MPFHKPSLMRRLYRKYCSPAVRIRLGRVRNLIENFLTLCSYKLFLFPRVMRSRLSINYLQVHNSLPNSGAVPVLHKFKTAQAVISAFPDASHRAQKIEGFDGFAPDDAVFDIDRESWKLLTFAGLAGFIACFCFQRYQNPSILELGCGPAYLFLLLKELGIKNYIGIDGSPYFLDLNRYLRRWQNHFLTLNLQDEIALYQGDQILKFDVVCSFEVLEHIRQDSVDALIKTMRNAMHAGSILFCTASLQDNIDVHVLVRSQEWWLRRFAGFGLMPHPDADLLRSQLSRNHPFNWDSENTNIFALIRGDLRPK